MPGEVTEVISLASATTQSDRRQKEKKSQAKIWDSSIFELERYSWIYLATLIKWNGRSQFLDIWGTLKIFKIALNIINYINLQDSIGYDLSNKFLHRKHVKISKKVVEVSHISQVPKKAKLYAAPQKNPKNISDSDLEWNWDFSLWKFWKKIAFSEIGLKILVGFWQNRPNFRTAIQDMLKMTVLQLS